jgi:hypothetical protein
MTNRIIFFLTLHIKTLSMKKNIILSSMTILTIAALFAFKIAGGVLPIGSPLPNPDLKVRDIHDRIVSLKEVKQQNGLLVMFSCNTCPYVIKNQERTRKICTFAMQNKIGVILLNSNETQRANEDSFDAMQAYGKIQGYDWYYAVDKDNILANAFGASRTPECYLFNKDLKLAYHGAIDDNPTDAQNVKREHLKVAINELLSGKDVTVKETRSVGCGIKKKD